MQDRSMGGMGGQLRWKVKYTWGQLEETSRVANYQHKFFAGYFEEPGRPENRQEGRDKCSQTRPNGTNDVHTWPAAAWMS